MQARCQCGMVAFITPTSRPLTVYHCHCLECRKQSASAYGTSAIFPAEPLFPLSQDLRNKLAVYTRSTDSGNTLDCYFCKACGVGLSKGLTSAALATSGSVVQ
ncbi:Mss4-like protein [Auriculariales sp. MPI-PUGE-AT-0066]|nr:Mss4-like protein [Auriculariales sp. MPI-PUGE-AT-0066]